ncbi:LysM peptidoglycan-binding domain-containing protein [Onishia taeanensis]
MTRTWGRLGHILTGRGTATGLRRDGDRARRRIGVGSLLLAIGLLTPGFGQAQGDLMRDDAPQRYTVVRGDTLWDISGRFLTHPWQWPRVWRVNPQIDNPHLIYPGDVILIRDCDGRPCLGLQRGQNVVKLSPEMRRIPRRAAIPPLPLEVVEPFLTRHRIVEASVNLSEQPYVVASGDKRLISGAGDSVFVRGALTPGRRYGLYRPGEVYRDAEGAILGQELLSIGEGRLAGREGDLGTLELLASRQEVRDGDLVMPLKRLELVGEFQPRPPEQAVEGRILSVPGGVRFIGRLHVVALDVGTRQGVAPGHVLAVEQQGEPVRDPRTEEPVRLPGVDAGLVMVFRSYDRVSYGLVMQATRTLAVGDRVHTPEPETLYSLR